MTDRIGDRVHLPGGSAAQDFRWRSWWSSSRGPQGARATNRSAALSVLFVGTPAYAAAVAERRNSLEDLEIALVGPDVSLQTVSVGRLAELLRAAEELIAAVAADLSLPPPTTSLIRLRNASAGYQLHSHDKQWRRTARRVETVIRSKGRRESLRVRERLRALHAVGGKAAKVRVTPVDPQGRKRGKELLVEAPPPTEIPVSFTATMYGRIVGLFERADGALVVQLDRDDGGRINLTADDAQFAAATALLRKPVKVSAQGTWDVEAQQASDWKLRSIEPWAEKDLLGTLSGVRDDLEKKGVQVDVDDLLRRLGE